MIVEEGVSRIELELSGIRKVGRSDRTLSVMIAMLQRYRLKMYISWLINSVPI